MIAYGMNDSNDERVGFTDERFRGNILELMRQIRDKLPLCEILLVSSIYGNPLTFEPSRYEAHANVLREIANDRAGQGVAFCDPQGIERFVLRRKAFADIMADNMVHPNDFGMRLIAQTIADSIRRTGGLSVFAGSPRFSA